MAGAAASDEKKLQEAQICASIVQGYSIDSRTVEPGELFFAVRGEKRDGHEFLEAALERGALAAVASRGPARLAARLLLVDDPRLALGRMAARMRERWGGKIVAITGSNGKTTTKEITAALLATRFRVAKSAGNLNNDLGLPLSLVRMEEAAEVGVMELGMNHPGEIRHLAAIARPEVGVVTNVNPVHLEFFDSVDEIAMAKRELIEALPTAGTAVLNADDERVSAFAQGFAGRVVTFGVEKPAAVRAVEVEDHGAEGASFRLEAGGERMRTPLPGRHNLYNTLAGLAAAEALGIAPGSLGEAVAALEPVRMRGEISEIRGIRIINDCYNSNPRAVEAMLDLLRATAGARHIAVLGEMLELGDSSEELHRQAGRQAAQSGVDLLAGVGGVARRMVEEATRCGAVAYFFEDARAAGEFLKTALHPGDVVLFKGSRGVKLERAVEALKTES